MKQFFKMTFATVAGIILFMVIMGILFAMSLVGMVASGSSTQSVEKNSVMVLNLNATLNERAESTNPLALLQGDNSENIGLDQVLDVIAKVK